MESAAGPSLQSCLLLTLSRILKISGFQVSLLLVTDGKMEKLKLIRIAINRQINSDILRKNIMQLSSKMDESPNIMLREESWSQKTHSVRVYLYKVQSQAQ